TEIKSSINNKGGIFERSRSVIDFRAIFVLLSKKIRHKEPDLRFPGPYRSSDLRIPGTVQKDVEMQYLFLSFSIDHTMDAVKRRCKQKIYDIGVQYHIAYRDKSCTYTGGNRFYNRRCIAGIQDNYRVSYGQNGTGRQPDNGCRNLDAEG
ncbi:MAG: hypothetical protein V8R61_06415, partial [Enterocloster sp.]